MIMVGHVIKAYIWCDINSWHEDEEDVVEDTDSPYNPIF